MHSLIKSFKSTIFYKKYRFWREFMLPEITRGQKYLIKKRFKQQFGYELDLRNPKTLNEKIQWLKIYDKNDFHTLCADKYRVRKYLGDNFGEQYLVPLLFQTKNYRDINPRNITTFPCIVKSNSGCGWYKILNDNESTDWKALQEECKDWMSRNFYYYSWEWQYKNIKPCIIVEKLLQTKDGKLPNDFKLHFINGELEFVYCSIDRLGTNYRRIYNPWTWERIYFEWPQKPKSSPEAPEVEKPPTFDKMVEIGAEIAKNFKYVRVDFYDLDGKLYFGEITLHQGSGFNHFVPNNYDLYFGEKLNLGDIE